MIEIYTKHSEKVFTVDLLKVSNIEYNPFILKPNEVKELEKFGVKIINYKRK